MTQILVIDSGEYVGNSLTKINTNFIDISGNKVEVADFNAFTGSPITHEKGGLEADVSAYSGLVKISAGSTSQAVAGVDYLPSGGGNFSYQVEDNNFKLWNATRGIYQVIYIVGTSGNENLVFSG